MTRHGGRFEGIGKLWAVGLLVALSTGARADPVTATLGSNFPSQYNIDFHGAGTAFTNQYAGPIQWTNGTGPLGANFTTFCVDLSHEIYPGNSYTYNLTGLQNITSIGAGSSGLFKEQLLSELFDKYYSQVTNAPPNSDSFFSNGASFQVAVWDIVFGNDTITPTGDLGLFDSTNGFYVDTESSGLAFVQTAGTWLNSLTGTAPVNPNLIGLAGTDGAQDQITVVPAPPSVWLAGLGGVALLFGIRRRRPTVV